MLLQLILHARRRLLYNALAAEGACAAALAAALLIVLLLLGTDILSWRWMIAMPAAALGAGAFLAIRRLPGLYRTARILDTRLRLSDTLATALFCGGPESERRFDSGMRRAQIARADAAARSVSLSVAVPFRTPRVLYAVAPLALVACSLFVLRYVWEDRLDLTQPMPAVARYLLRLSDLELSVFGTHQEPQARRQTTAREDGRDGADRARSGGRQLPSMPADNLPSTPQARADGKAKSASAAREAAAQAGEQNSENSQAANGSGEQQPDPSGQQARQGDTTSSLMAKLSDAVRGMLSRLGPENSRNNQSARGNDPGRQGGNRMEQRPGGGQAKSRQSSGEANGVAQQAGSRQGQQGQGTSGSGKSGETSDKQPGSSAGSNDGAKDLKQAEQLAAMGKISVILGKRSETVTGNATVETVSGRQSLVTPYTDARDAHAQSNAAIDRDEVPVALQDYVQRYFVALRTRAPKTPTAAGKK